MLCTHTVMRECCTYINTPTLCTVHDKRVLYVGVLYVGVRYVGVVRGCCT